MEDKNFKDFAIKKVKQTFDFICFMFLLAMGFTITFWIVAIFVMITTDFIQTN